MKRLLIGLLLASVSGPPLAAATSVEYPSKTTSDQRLRIAAAMRSLEDTPLLDEASDARSQAFTWVVQSQDLDLVWCAGVLADATKDQTELWSGLTVQAVLSAAAFSLESPSQAKERLLVARAGVRGALKTYEATVAARPSPRSGFFDRLATLDDAGRLDEVIAPRLAACEAEPAGSSFFDPDGYYFLIDRVGRDGYVFTVFDLDTIEYDYDGRLHYEAPRSVSPSARAEFRRVADGSTRRVDCSAPVVSRDGFTLVCPWTPMGSMSIRGTFVVKGGQFWNRGDVTNETVVAVARVSATRDGASRVWRGVRFAYSGGD